MSLIVQKFGGTSVADPARIRAAARKAVATQAAGHQVVMVVSARGKKTDELVQLAAEITDSPSAREMDMLLSTGEQESVALMAMAVAAEGAEAISLTGGQIGIRTDSAHTEARIIEISTRRMREALEGGRIVIAAGFQGIDDDLNITTLGRGGSDTTATALAAVLQADVCEIYTDVEGVLSTDPRCVPAARRLARISYDEMLELASLGSGVMHARSIEFAKKYQVAVRVRPAHCDGEGTLIAPESEESPPLVTGVALAREEARVGLVGLPDRPGVMSRIFSRLEEQKLPVDMIVQDIGRGGLAEVSFTVPEANLPVALEAAGAAVTDIGQGSVEHVSEMSKVSAVGRGMRSHTGVAAHMFRSLVEVGVNLLMITTSEIKVSVLVDRDCGEQAIEAVHQGFGLHEEQLESPAVGFGLEKGPGGGDVGRDEIEREVVSRLARMEDIVVSEVVLDDEQSRITVRDVPDMPGVAATLFSAVAEGGILVDLIVQNQAGAGSSREDGCASLSLTVPRRDLDPALLLVREVAEQWEATVGFERDIAMLSVIGIGLRSHTGVGAKMFHALGEAGINIQMINTSEIRVSVVVDLADGGEGHRCLAHAFQI
ncbi:MAG: aspartate kinase [Planctomycetaceae bacterium]|nr:aspartate kinase [Planctomycetaceae bacterium]